MSKTASLSVAELRKSRTGVRDLAICALFAAVQLTPKLLDLRRNQRSWFGFRLLLGSLGAALVILPLAIWNAWLFSILGLGMFLASILLPPAKRETRLQEKARELGARVVVKGGEYQPGNGPRSLVRLFIGPEHIWALDSHMQPRVVIPSAAVAYVRAERIPDAWVVRARWLDHSADFEFRGVLAEHFARAAEANIRSVMRPGLPVVKRARAARA